MSLIKIKMKETMWSGADGGRMNAGEVYEIPVPRGELFISKGWAEPVVARVPAAKVEKKPSTKKTKRAKEPPPLSPVKEQGENPTDWRLDDGDE